LLPPSPQDWLPTDHLAYFVRDVVSTLDMSVILASYSSDGRGAAAYSPSMMLSVIFYGWLRDVYSCRKLARLCREDLGARVLVGAEQPDFRSLNRFRLVHGNAMDDLYLQSVLLCSKAGMVTMTDMAVDGTRISSYGSKGRNIRYGRIEAEEERHRAFLREAKARADAADAEEDSLFGPDEAGPALKEEVASREKRLELLGKAKAAMDADAKERAAANRKRWDETPPKERPHTKRPDPETATPEDTDQYNPVDPESRVQYSCQSGFIQGYNGQVAVDADSQVIVACDLTNSPTDVGLLPQMLDQVEKNLGSKPERVLADSGYYSAKNVEDVRGRNMTPLIPPVLKKSERAAEPPADLTDDEVVELSAKNWMRYMLAQPSMKVIFGKRRTSVETVFGQIKGSPGNPGHRRFLRLTLEKCRQDWFLICCLHNLSKYRGFKTA